MGSLSSKTYVEHPDRSIGTAQDAWTRQTCPVPLSIQGSECIQTGVNNPWALAETCNNLPTCAGFDWDPLGATATFHNQANLEELQVTPGQVAFIQEHRTNWALIVGIIGVGLALTLFILALFIASRLHTQEQLLKQGLVETESPLFPPNL